MNAYFVKLGIYLIQLVFKLVLLASIQTMEFAFNVNKIV